MNPQRPRSSVGSVQVLRTGGRWFDPWRGQYAFQGIDGNHLLKQDCFPATNLKLFYLYRRRKYRYHIRVSTYITNN